MTTVLIKHFEECEKNATLLRASVNAYKPYDPQKEYTADELEYYDALTSRFARFADIIISGLFRSLELYLLNKSSETIPDRLLQMQKLGIITDAEMWYEIRKTRNKIVHTYEGEAMKQLTDNILKYAPELFRALEQVGKQIQNLRNADTD